MKMNQSTSAMYSDGMSQGNEKECADPNCKCVDCQNHKDMEDKKENKMEMGKEE